MKLSEAVKCFEECMGPDNADGAGGCLYENCPLHEDVLITSGEISDEVGEITWRIEGCSLMGKWEDLLKDKKAGTPYPEEADGKDDSH